MRARLLVAAAVVGLLAGCGSPAGETGTGGHNEADVAFAQGMIPHHAQAVEMAEQATEQATTARVRRLAVAVAAAQDPEIATMTGWLREWGEEVPSAHAMDHDDQDEKDGMAGMMSASQLDRLDRASGPAYDRLWLRLMVAHHEGAIAAARTEVADGRDPRAVGLARRIEAGQQAEVTRMRAWLSRS